MAKDAHRNESMCLHFFASSFVCVGLPSVSFSLSGFVFVCFAALLLPQLCVICFYSFVFRFLSLSFSPSFPSLSRSSNTPEVFYLFHAFPHVYSITLFVLIHSLFTLRSANVVSF